MHTSFFLTLLIQFIYVEGIGIHTHTRLYIMSVQITE